MSGRVAFYKRMHRLLRSPWLRFAVILIIVVAAVEAFAGSIDVGRLAARLASADARYVTAATVVYIFSWSLRGVRYRDILRSTGYECGTAAMTGAVFVSQTSNLVFPARAGDGTRAYIVKKRSGVPYTSGFASLAAERVLDLVAVLVIGGAGFALTIQASDGFHPTRGDEALLAASAVGAATVGAVAVVYLIRRDSLRDRVGGNKAEGEENSGLIDEVLGAVGEFVAEFGTVFEDSDGTARLLSASLGIWLVDVATCVMVFYALGVAFEGVVAVSLLAVSVGNLAKVVPATPGGIGLYEAGFAAVVVATTGVGWEAAVAVAVFDHALKNGVTVVGGVGSALALNVSLTHPAEAGDEA